ncbi:MAG: hypothetical protein HZA50_04355 [Planctomycetes bacterium]|nr:hypothetical protein [Planctomycetota bacterium]
MKQKGSIFMAKVKMAVVIVLAASLPAGLIALAAGENNGQTRPAAQATSAAAPGNQNMLLPGNSARPDASGKYSWQKPHAKVLPNGDLEWSPEPFVFEKGDSVRYIDFEAGDDGKDGSSKEQAWKHHPWDANATGKAKECKGIHTYIFKRGVAYRGSMVATESGQPGNPIRLTSDPSWGTGEASLLGSERLDKGWEKCKAGQVPGMPEIEKVWCRKLPDGVPARALWEIGKDGPVRIPIARTPNWTITDPNDPQAGFWIIKETIKTPFTICDPEHLKGMPDITGATVWSDWNGNMGTLYRTQVKKDSFNSGLGQFGRDSIRNKSAGQAPGNRYYLENLPAFLDSPGEYWVDRKTDKKAEKNVGDDSDENGDEKPEGKVEGKAEEKGGQIYLRLPGDRDPNNAHIEASARAWLLNIVDQSHIRVSGLRFAFNDIGRESETYPVYYGEPACIRAAGSCCGIKVDHCRFEHVAGVFTAFTRMDKKLTDAYMKDLPQPWKVDLIDDIVITDNDIAWVDRGNAISLWDGKGVWGMVEPPFGMLGNISILRNRMRWIGHRPGGDPNSNIPAISIKGGRLVEIAGNDIQHCLGTGIFTKGGKDRMCTSEVPLIRILIHHNRVVDTVLACNDYGGLSAWQGGPNYVYNNVVGNAVGFKAAPPVGHDWKTVAYNIYLDGTFKSYTFNNVVWGRSNDVADPYYSRGGYMVVLGFMNHLFNNTFYKFRYGLVGSSGNRSTYLGNIFADISSNFINQNNANDTSLKGGDDTGTSGNQGVPTLAFGRNIFSGKVAKFGNIGVNDGSTLEKVREKLGKVPVLLAELGIVTPDNPLADPAKGDFRPKADSPGKAKGVKFFAPWGLSATVAEWNFYANPRNPDTVMGENFYMTADYLDRYIYDEIPRNPLKVKDATVADYVPGVLEDWTNGALHFDGKARFGVLADADLKSDFKLPVKIVKGKVERIKKDEPETVIKGADRRTVDVGICNLLIEAYFRTEKAHAGSTLVSKAAAGYLLGFDAQGHACLTLKSDGKNAVSLAGRTAVNDGTWHHVIAEVDRAAKRATIYVDGKIDGETKGFTLDPAASLGNNADLLVGKGPEGGFFAGDLDFLRICRGTLADAMTTIEELYAWQTDGPHLRDFNGVKPADGERCAGAIQGQ